MCEANPTEINMLRHANFSINSDGEWRNGKWSILLHEDFVSVSHEDWVAVEGVGSVNEAIELVQEKENL